MLHHQGPNIKLTHPGFRLENGAVGYAILDNDEDETRTVTAALLRFDFIGHNFLLLQEQSSTEWVRVGMGHIYGQ